MGKKVLIVDDDPTIRTLVGAILQKEGYEVQKAEDGRAALTLLEKEKKSTKFEFIILDVVMPGMSGRELADKMVDLFPEIVVLYLSGYTDDAVVRHGLLRAEVNFLQKPFTPRMLANKLQDLLD